MLISTVYAPTWSGPITPPRFLLHKFLIVPRTIRFVFVGAEALSMPLKTSHDAYRAQRASCFVCFVCGLHGIGDAYVLAGASAQLRSYVVTRTNIFVAESLRRTVVARNEHEIQKSYKK